MQRRFLDYLIITFKGLAMGAADVVPGVSGGTIAFISGIYEELLESIDGVNFSFFKIWKAKGFKNAWLSINGNFLLALFFNLKLNHYLKTHFHEKPKETLQKAIARKRRRTQTPLTIALKHYSTCSNQT